MTSIDVRNRSKHVISVQSAHTGKAYEIAASDHERIPHTAGDLIVTVAGPMEVSRLPVFAPEYETEKTYFLRSWPCWRGLLIRAEFTDARGLTVLNAPCNH
jgi:hypothetical protein